MKLQIVLIVLLLAVVAGLMVFNQLDKGHEYRLTSPFIKHA